MEGYLHALAAASPRVRVESFGLSTEGRPLLLARVSSQENLEAPGAAVPVLVTASLHADEPAPALAALRVIHRLASARSPEAVDELRRIEALVVPVANPDGLDLVHSWATAGRGVPLPRLYHRFAGHDNNRDWMLLTQVETRAFVRLIALRRPRLVIDIHGMGPPGPRLFVPPYGSPVSPWIPPRLLALCDRLGSEVRARLERRGFEGVVSGELYDLWTPARAYPFFHGAPRLLIEVAGADLFRPVRTDASPDGAGEGGGWDISRAGRHAAAALEEALAAIAADPGAWREERAEESGRPLFLLPDPASDPRAARDLLEALRLAGAAVGCLPAAPWWGLPPEPPRGWPDGSARSSAPRPIRPARRGSRSTGICHDLARLAGLTVEPAGGGGAGWRPEPGPVAVKPARPFPSRGPAGAFLLEARSPSVLGEVEELLEAGIEARRTREPARAGGIGFPAGSILLPRPPRAWLARVVRRTGARAALADGVLPSSTLLRRAEAAVLSGGRPSIDEGWTRWLLEEHRVPFRSCAGIDAPLGGLELVVAPEGTLPARDETGRLRSFVEGGGRLVAVGRSARAAAAALRLPVRELRRRGGAPVRLPGIALRARPAAGAAGHALLAGGPPATGHPRARGAALGHRRGNAALRPAAPRGRALGPAGGRRAGGELAAHRGGARPGVRRPPRVPPRLPRLDASRLAHPPRRLPRGRFPIAMSEPGPTADAACRAHRPHWVWIFPAADRYNSPPSGGIAGEMVVRAP